MNTVTLTYDGLATADIADESVATAQSATSASVADNAVVAGAAIDSAAVAIDAEVLSLLTTVDGKSTAEGDN